ncbi:MAG: LPXTG cell wall anchor domain-containing protein, partial [Roseomonas sp.]|nr:LPXTG cell wall anchor domain-containing protein [Roseomonas sp.]
MDDRRRQTTRIDGVDILVLAIFGSVVILSAWMVFKSGPETAAGVLLLAGLTGFVALGFLMFRNRRRPATDFPYNEGQFLSALEEPAAIAAVEGRIRYANSAWLELMGPMNRLPRASASAPGLFVAIKDARRGRIGRAMLVAGSQVRSAVITTLG